MWCEEMMKDWKTGKDGLVHIAHSVGEKTSQLASFQRGELAASRAKANDWRD
jgi:hypothetical protein